MKVAELKGKKIVVLGFGREGQDTYRFLRKTFPAKDLAVADQKRLSEFPAKLQKSVRKDRNLKTYLGLNYLRHLKDYNVIVKTPGIPLQNIKKFLNRGVVVTSQTEIFFDNCPNLIIGVTGTKGKGTTSSLIYEILKAGELKAHLIGNIGTPALSYLSKIDRGEHMFVYELSSHQLQGLKKSPHIAVFLNLFPDHLDYYQSFKEYQQAKENITIHQAKNDFLIYNANDPLVSAIAQKSKAKKIPVCLKSKVTHIQRPLYMCYRLKGDFNRLNLMAAIAAAGILKVPEAKIKQAVAAFKGLPHRLERVGKYQGIEFYNDSMATIPESTIAALNGLGSKVKTLIIGGSDKGSDYAGLAKAIIKSNVKTLIIFPGTGKKVWQKIKQARAKSPLNQVFVDSMEKAVRTAFKKTKKGEICLLSPAAASFNLFKSYEERGNLFKKYILEYEKEKPAIKKRPA